MKVYDKDDASIPYVMLETGDKLEDVINFCYDKGANTCARKGDKFDEDKFNIMPFGFAFPRLYRRAELELFFPVPRVRYIDFPNAKGSDGGNG